MLKKLLVFSSFLFCTQYSVQAQIKIDSTFGVNGVFKSDLFASVVSIDVQQDNKFIGFLFKYLNACRLRRCYLFLPKKRRMKIDKGLSRKEFKEKYPDNSSCLQYLAELKWADGYECKGCKSTTYSRGKQPYSRRCTKCQYDESATSGTLFHKIKFSISLAFEMLYEIVTSKKDANSVWLVERFQLQQKNNMVVQAKGTGSYEK
ncbi:MAG: transposase [Sporocytophaga sp.]|nr:transposase [Sporocytophaga sp.]